MTIFFYLLLTLLIEMPLVVLFFRSQWKLALITGVLLNLFTWPLLHLLIYSFNLNINLLEFGVAITEGAGYLVFMRCSWKKAFAVSLLVNGLSYGIGLLVNYYT
jgi:hypothetical protein